jgi:hypothetical protein
MLQRGTSDSTRTLVDKRLIQVDSIGTGMLLASHFVGQAVQPRAEEYDMRSLHGSWGKTVRALLVSGVGVGVVAAMLPTMALAQTRPALVRSVDEPARVPYAYSLLPTCPFSNVCEAAFPTVPAGKRLRVTEVRLMFRFTNDPGFLAVNLDARGSVLVAFPVAPFSGHYYGNLVSGAFPVDMIFEAGQRPVLEFGVNAFSGGINVNSANRFAVTGYLVDVTP